MLDCGGRHESIEISLQFLETELFFCGLSDSVMVAQGSLEAFVLVQIQVGQPFPIYPLASQNQLSALIFK